MRQTRKSELSPNRQWLVERLQDINFGEVFDLAIVNGEPMLEDPAPRVVRAIKIGCPIGPRDERRLDQFQLKAALCELFDLFDRMGCGRVVRIDVRHGLPYLVEVADKV